MVAAKAVTALIGSLLTLLIPYVVQMSASLPQPWPVLIGAIVSLLTMFGVYKVPNKKPADPAAGGAPTPGGYWPNA